MTTKLQAQQFARDARRRSVLWYVMAVLFGLGALFTALAGLLGAGDAPLDNTLLGIAMVLTICTALFWLAAWSTRRLAANAAANPVRVAAQYRMSPVAKGTLQVLGFIVLPGLLVAVCSLNAWYGAAAAFVGMLALQFYLVETLPASAFSGVDGVDNHSRENWWRDRSGNFRTGDYPDWS